jgi:hypothetical protein
MVIMRCGNGPETLTDRDVRPGGSGLNSDSLKRLRVAGFRPRSACDVIDTPAPPARADRYRLEIKKSRLVWKSLMRSTGTLGQRWLRRKARQDWTIHPVAPDVDLVTFWLDQRIGGGGTGVCMSLFCHGYEVLRFDCFGRELGHYHLSPLTLWTVRRRVLGFYEDTIEGQVEEALFQIDQNLDFYLQLNPRRCVRKLRIEREARKHACDRARLRLHEYLNGVPVLQPLRSQTRPADSASG